MQYSPGIYSWGALHLGHLAIDAQRVSAHGSGPVIRMKDLAVSLSPSQHVKCDLTRVSRQQEVYV